MHRRTLLLASATLAAGCASTPDPEKAEARREDIDRQVASALAELFASTPQAQAFAEAAQGVLVFPQVFTAGLLVGGSFGHGALRKGGANVGYYSLTSGSVGLLAGAQTRTLFVFFMSPAAMDRFQQSSGWTFGGDASAVVLDAGAMARLDRRNAPEIVALARNQQGFMANFSLDGTRVRRLAI
jgi:lipid-binding SYLF domain-containing protein